MRKLRENELEFLKAFMDEAGTLTEGPAHLAVKALGVDYLEVTQVFAVALRLGEIKGSMEGNPSMPWTTKEEVYKRRHELGLSEEQ